MNLITIRRPLEEPAAGCLIKLLTDRQILARRRWRGAAVDGTEFAFVLERPLAHGSPVYRSHAATYIVEQQPEALLDIPLQARTGAVARLAWTLGNLHIAVQIADSAMTVLEEPAIIRFFEREKIPFSRRTGVFFPFAQSHAHRAGG
jgi:urease accessory protein